MFTTWNSAEVQKQMESGNSTDKIEAICAEGPEVLTCHLAGEPHLAGSVGKRNIAKGWSKAGIPELFQGKTTLSPEDPFENIAAIII